MTVVEVMKELPPNPRRLINVWRPLLSEAPQELVVRERQEQLTRCLEPVRQQGVEDATKVLVGDPFLEVTREVLRNGHDLVMMTAEGRGGLTGCSGPPQCTGAKMPLQVWVVKASQHERYARILAAVDTNPDDARKDALNSTIMELATSLAEGEESELHIVHAWTIYGEDILRRWGRTPDDQMAIWLRETQDRHQVAVMERLLGKSDLANLQHRIHLGKGEAGCIIPKVAHEARRSDCHGHGMPNRNRGILHRQRRGEDPSGRGLLNLDGQAGGIVSPVTV